MKSICLVDSYIYCRDPAVKIFKLTESRDVISTLLQLPQSSILFCCDIWGETAVLAPKSPPFYS